MIQLIDSGLEDFAISKLADYQKLIDDKPTYPERVVEAKKKFKSSNTTKNRAFIEVKKKLSLMCCGPDRCNYCEDSKADEVEHIYPKDWYPEKCFVWMNYCYACGTCNGPKNNKFAVLKRIDGTVVELIRDKDSDIIEPEEGETVLINPRLENPLDYLFLDISNTFFFTSMDDDTASEASIRAEYTIKILGLNSRSYLVKARKLAFSNFESRLSDYITKRNAGANQNQLDNMIENIKGEHHQTVWSEMKRQKDIIPVLQNLFMDAPEALLW